MSPERRCHPPIPTDPRPSSVGAGRDSHSRALDPGRVRPPPWLFPENRALLLLGALAVAQPAFWCIAGPIWTMVELLKTRTIPGPMHWAAADELRLLVLTLPILALGATALLIGARRQRRIRALLLEPGALFCWACGNDLRHACEDGRCNECGRPFSVAELRRAYDTLAGPRWLPLGWRRRVLGLLEVLLIIAVLEVCRAISNTWLGREWTWRDAVKNAAIVLLVMGPLVWLVQQGWAWVRTRRAGNCPEMRLRSRRSGDGL